MSPARHSHLQFCKTCNNLFLVETKFAPPHTFQSNTQLLGVHSDNGDTKRVLALVKEMMLQKIGPDSVTFHMLIRAFQHFPNGTIRPS